MLMTGMTAVVGVAAAAPGDVMPVAVAGLIVISGGGAGLDRLVVAGGHPRMLSCPIAEAVTGHGGAVAVAVGFRCRAQGVVPSGRSGSGAVANGLVCRVWVRPRSSSIRT